MREGSAYPSNPSNKAADASPLKSTPAGVFADPPAGRGIIAGIKMDERGTFVKLYRQFGHHWIVQEPVVLQVFMVLFTDARGVACEKRSYHLEAGESDLTEQQIATRIKSSRSAVNRALQKLEKNRTITRRVIEQRRNVITFVNWAYYQSRDGNIEQEPGQGSGQEPNESRASREPVASTPKEREKEKKGESADSPSPPAHAVEVEHLVDKLPYLEQHRLELDKLIGDYARRTGCEPSKAAERIEAIAVDAVMALPPKRKRYAAEAAMDAIKAEAATVALVERARKGAA